MAAPKYESTRRELVEVMRRATGQGDREFDIAKAFLEIKAQESVGRATWVLALATVGLIVATVVNVIVTLCG
jgi:hypothetical protein